jgi:hypothetical protein
MRYGAPKRDGGLRQIGLLPCVTASSETLGDGLRVRRYSSIANAGVVLPPGALVLAPAHASSQVLQKRLRVHQISRVKALGELLID